MAKKGLDYFPLTHEIFENENLVEVQNKYGPLGEAVYFRLLSLIFQNGYYYRFDSIDKLANKLIKSIGNLWADDKKIVIEIIWCLTDNNLFSRELMCENVITSKEVQQRYLRAMERRQCKITEYNLLEKSAEEAPADSSVREDNTAKAEKNAALAEAASAKTEKNAALAEAASAKTEKNAALAEATSAKTGKNAALAEATSAKTGENVAFSPLREIEGKGKEGKGKEANGNEAKASEAKASAARAPAEIDRAYLTESFGEENVADYEKRFERWSRGKKSLNVPRYETIYKWLIQDGVTKPASSTSIDMDMVMQRIIRSYE